MAEFSVIIQKITQLEYTVEAKDKIDASMTAIQKAINNMDISGDDKYEVIQVSPNQDPQFQISETVKINDLNVSGLIMKRRFSDLDNDYMYKVLYSNGSESILGTFYEYQLSNIANGAVHN